MNFPRWLPFLGWVELDAELAAAAGLDLDWRWKGLVFEWFGGGMILWGKAYEQR